MTINEMIVSELKPLGLPIYYCHSNSYRSCFIFNYTTEQTNFYNDKAHSTIFHIQLNFYYLNGITEEMLSVVNEIQKLDYNQRILTTTSNNEVYGVFMKDVTIDGD